MNQSKKLAKTLCVMVTATSVAAQSLIFTEPVHMFAEPIVNAAETETIKEIDISTVDIENKMRTIILENGRYRITGSNYDEKNSVYIFTQIIVPENKTVDIYFAGAEIHHPELRRVEPGCGIPYLDAVSPLIVNGTANIYVEENTGIFGADKLLTVSDHGTVNIMKSENNALLTFQTHVPSGACQDFYMTTGSGTINMINGNVLFKNDNNESDTECYNTKFHIMGGTIEFYSKPKKITFRDEVIIDGGNIKGVDFSDRDAHNSNGDPVIKHTFPGITPSTNIVQVGSYQQNSLVTDADGKMNDIYVPKEKDAVLYTGDKADKVYKAYVYKYENGSYSDNPTELKAYRVTFMFEGKVFDSYLVKENDTLKLPTAIAWSYTFTANDESFTKDTKITRDTIIEMEKCTKICGVTIDETVYQAVYGTELKECGGYQEGAIYQDKSGNLCYDDYVITCDIELTKLDLEFEYIDDQRFLKIATLQQLELFATLVNNGYTNLNGILLDNIEEDFTTPIGTDTNKYIGTFDGQGHSVNLAIESTDDYQGMFGVVSGGVTIKNVVTTGTVKGNYACAGIVGGSKGSGNVTIDGCINKADVTGTHTDGAGIIATNTGSEATYSITNCGNQGHIVSKEYASAMCAWSGYETIIKNCYNVGKIENYDEDKSFIRGNSNVTIDNCYQISTVKSQGNVTSKEETAFHSGEVTYLLNGDQSNIIWLQTCDDKSYPVICGDKKTQTVYYGYPNCTATEKTYHNNLLSKNYHKYQFQLDNKHILAECEYCDNFITADLVYEDCFYDGNEHGIDIIYGNGWKEEMPEFTVLYASQVDGTYSTEKPVEAGTWYAKICRSDTEEPVFDSISFVIQKKYEVTVIGGNGTGSYVSGEPVSITAAEAATGKKFAGWSVVSGAAVTFEDAQSETTTFIMPADAVTIQATYIDISKPDPEPARPTVPEQQPSFTGDTSESNTKTVVEIKQDGTVVTTTVEVLEDGSTRKTVTESFKDGTKRTSVTISRKDGSTTVTIEDSDGSTSITHTTNDGSSEYRKTFTDPITMAKVLIIEKKDTKGEISSSKATITVKGEKNSNKIKIPAMSSVINKIKKTTQSGHVDITYQVSDENSDPCYHVEVNSADLVSKNKLSVYIYDNKKKKYIPTDIKGITVNKWNSISINLPMLDKEEYSYQLVNTADKEKINRDILNKIELKKKSISLPVGKKVKISFTGLDMDMVAKIRYVSLNKKIVTVDQKGNLVAKKKGQTVIKVAVRLKNNKTKFLTVNVTVK